MYQGISTATGEGRPAIGTGVREAVGSKIVVEKLFPCPAITVCQLDFVPRHIFSSLVVCILVGVRTGNQAAVRDCDKGGMASLTSGWPPIDACVGHSRNTCAEIDIPKNQTDDV